MKLKIALVNLIFSGLTSTIFSSGFVKNPWIDSFLQCDFDTSFLYRKYSNVNGGYNPSPYSSIDRFTQLDVKAVVYPDMDLQFLIEFADTRRQRLGTQSLGLQGRYQILDDRRGDLFSLTTSFNGRYVFKRSLYDVSCPYHSRLNFELGSSFGKEIDFSENTTFSPNLFLGVGQGIKGMPWVRSWAAFEFLLKKIHTLAPFIDGYFGFGKTHRVNVSDFYGYGTIFHQSIDVGFYYKCDFSQIWGSFSIYWAYRPYAKNYPENANTLVVYYRFPFSFF